MPDRQFGCINNKCKTGVEAHSRGFVHRSVAKRLKSLSVENRRAPFSMARAARWASEVKLAAVPSCARSSIRIDQCCSVGTIMRDGGCFSHSSMISMAVSEGRGVGIILPLVIILKNPKITIQEKPKGSSPNKDASSHFFALW